jgi:hypothetical protein
VRASAWLSRLTLSSNAFFLLPTSLLAAFLSSTPPPPCDHCFIDASRTLTDLAHVIDIFPFPISRFSFPHRNVYAFVHQTALISSPCRVLSPLTLPTYQGPSDIADADDLFMVQSIYDTLWNKSLDLFLCKSTAESSGTTVSYSYFTSALIEKLHLFLLKFQEEILLVREEYVTAYDVMKSWSSSHKGGVVITGQPGIGEQPSPTTVGLLLG